MYHEKINQREAKKATTRNNVLNRKVDISQKRVGAANTRDIRIPLGLEDESQNGEKQSAR